MDRNLRTLSITFFAVVFCGNCAYAQSPTGTTGSWLMFFNQTRLHEKWSLHMEAQYRSFEITPNTEQILLRVGANFHINNNYSVSAGFAYVPNYAFDKEQLPGVQVSEKRTWQQLIMRNKLGRANFEHRYRLEQRWLQSDSSDKYLNRIRYLIRAIIPVNKKTIEKNALFLSFYNEIFIHFSPAPFDRNRFYAAVGYQVLPTSNVQLGYLAQTVNITTKHYLQAAFFYNLDLRKK